MYERHEERHKEAVEKYRNGKEDNKDLEVLELDLAQKRADIGGMCLDEREGIPSEDEDTESTVRTERTGVIHLVHSWYAVGHIVSNLKPTFSLVADSFPEEDDTLC